MQILTGQKTHLSQLGRELSNLAVEIASEMSGGLDIPSLSLRVERSQRYLAAIFFPAENQLRVLIEEKAVADRFQDAARTLGALLASGAVINQIDWLRYTFIQDPFREPIESVYWRDYTHKKGVSDAMITDTNKAMVRLREFAILESVATILLAANSEFSELKRRGGKDRIDVGISAVDLDEFSPFALAAAKFASSASPLSQLKKDHLNYDNFHAIDALMYLTAQSSRTTIRDHCKLGNHISTAEGDVLKKIPRHTLLKINAILTPDLVELFLQNILPIYNVRFEAPTFQQEVLSLLVKSVQNLLAPGYAKQYYSLH